MSETSVVRTALAYLALAASMATVGTYVGFSKALVIVFPVFLLAGMRFAIGAVAMAPWLRRPAGEATLDGSTRRLLFFESFFGNFLFSICMLYGVGQSSALAAGVIMAALPAVVALLSWLWLGERVGARTAAGIACAIAGIALVALARDAEGELASGSLAGSALLLAAVTCEALYVVIGKTLSESLGPKRISALINLWGLVLVAPLALWQLRDFSPAFIPASSWLLLVVYSLAASVVTVWLWMTGLKHVPAASAGIFTVFLPVSAAAVGVLFYGERFTTSQVAAFALALGGVVLATWPLRR
ncbi:MAG TPA: DMT family transporter [Caldimonas sp.]|jgi:drug/metabolite transporter (DMT)-like permease|nr:DMT family transporter [Caldimonas sp.]HEX4235730.1 DMT family transporter [Caldimonas sp.]